MKVRQSTLGTASDCMRKLQFELEAGTYHGGVVRAVGTAYHYGLELFYDPARDITDIDLLVAGAIRRFDEVASMAPSHESEFEKTPGTFKWDEKFPDAASAHEAIEKMLRAYFATPGTVWPDDWTVLAVEQSFAQPFYNGHTRNGSIDLVLQDPNGYIIGEDHKTAGRAWPATKHLARKQAQPPWYVAALMELYPDAPGYRFFYDIMTYAGKWERREVLVTPEHIAATESRAIEVVTLVAGMRKAGMELPANPGSNLCSPRYCDWWDVCPFGAALDLQ